MKYLTIYRTEQNDEHTLGLLVTDNFTCRTLEPPWKNNKRNISCIPAGKYTALPYSSRRFGKTYILQNVPGRTGILIHVGNTIDDTSGCILPGMKTGYLGGRRAVLQSRKAFSRLMNVLNGEPVEIEIVNCF